ncbi:hypothetical protein HJFPF1_02172 [Paramyrothecium foliicola]|nr:hypothetical protein HJFPF1_02172 [Paramyrothecium foliicola]
MVVSLSLRDIFDIFKAAFETIQDIRDAPKTIRRASRQIDRLHSRLSERLLGLNGLGSLTSSQLDRIESYLQDYMEDIEEAAKILNKWTKHGSATKSWDRFVSAFSAVFNIIKGDPKSLKGLGRSIDKLCRDIYSELSDATANVQIVFLGQLRNPSQLVAMSLSRHGWTALPCVPTPLLPFPTANSQPSLIMPQIQHLPSYGATNMPVTQETQITPLQIPPQHAQPYPQTAHTRTMEFRQHYHSPQYGSPGTKQPLSVIAGSLQNSQSSDLARGAFRNIKCVILQTSRSPNPKQASSKLLIPKAVMPTESLARQTLLRTNNSRLIKHGVKDNQTYNVKIKPAQLPKFTASYLAT